MRLPQVELLQDLQLLLLARGQRPAPAASSRARNGIVSMKSPIAVVSAAQSITNGMLAPRQHQVLGDGHVGDQREVLIDHADAQRRARRAGC